MKILMVARRYPPDVRSGTETVFENLYREARKHHDVRLVVGYRTSSEGFPAEAVAVDLRGKGPLAYVLMEKAAVAEARRFKPDVVLSNSIEIRVPGVPNSVIVHDLNFGKAERSAGNKLRELLYIAQGRTLPSVITVSEATAVRLREVGIPPAKIAVIGNGVAIDRFLPSDPGARGKGTPEAPVQFAYPSRVIPGKGQHVAIDALARMRPDQKARARLTIVGAAPDAIYADRLKIEAYNQPVDFHFDVPDIIPYYQAADVVVFPTLMEEGFGFTAVEGMACGKPVVWCDQPAIREATGGIGFPVPRDDAEALKKAMVRLMDDPEERRRVGAAGRTYIESRSWAAVWTRYEAVLAGLCR